MQLVAKPYLLAMARGIRTAKAAFGFAPPLGRRDVAQLACALLDAQDEIERLTGLLRRLAASSIDEIERLRELVAASSGEPQSEEAFDDEAFWQDIFRVP